MMNDSDTKFIMEEEIEEEKNENDRNYGGDLLFSDANIHIVLAKNGEDENKNAKKNKRKQLKKFHHLLGRKEECTLKAEGNARTLYNL